MLTPINDWLALTDSARLELLHRTELQRDNAVTLLRESLTDTDAGNRETPITSRWPEAHAACRS
jgi:hypothetical protein